MRYCVSVHPTLIANEAFSPFSPTECSVWALAFLLGRQQSCQLDQQPGSHGRDYRDRLQVSHPDYSSSEYVCIHTALVKVIVFFRKW